jgi:hypothetical protein
MIKQIEDWKSILLDTGVIIDYLTLPERITKNDKHKKRVENTHKLFKYFSETSLENKRILFVTAITLSELRKRIGDETILKTIVSLFNTSTVLFVDFTKEMAMQIHTHIDLIKADSHLNSFFGGTRQRTEQRRSLPSKWLGLR